MAPGCAVRVAPAAVLALRGLIERHLREHGWSGTEALEDTTLDGMNLSAFLLAALEYVREQHALIGPDAIAMRVPEADAAGAHRALVDAFPRRDHAFSVDACVDALASVVSFEIVDAAFDRRDASPRVYRYYPFDWPAALANAVDWTECVFGVVAEEGWFADQARRDQVFRTLCPAYYEDESFTEIHGEAASRLAGFLLAGPDDRRSVDVYETQARAFVRLFGSKSRVFANRDFDVDEIENPFAHAEIVCWSIDGFCSSGRQLILVVTDGTQVARLEARWDTSAE
jgi:hypothetical protein